MNKIGAVLAGTLVLMATTAALAESGPGQVPNGSQELVAPAPPANPPAGPSGNLPQFSIGQLPVHVWTPVETPYDANMNRNQAANPIWGSDAGQSNGGAVDPLSATGSTGP